MPNIPNITTRVDFRKGNLFGDWNANGRLIEH